MKIVVCIKQVPDTAGGVKFNPDGTLDRGAMLTIMNPDDKAGLEAALRIKEQNGAEVNIVNHLPRLRDKSRKTMEIVEILGYDQATRDYKLNVLYQFQELPQSTKEKVVGQLTRTGNSMKNTYKLENAGIYREI